MLRNFELPLDNCRCVTVIADFADSSDYREKSNATSG